MRTYSAEFKASIIEKLLPPQHVEVVQLAQESGIPKDTLYSWRSRSCTASVRVIAKWAR